MQNFRKIHSMVTEKSALQTYVHTYVRTYVRTNSGDFIGPFPSKAGGPM